MKLTFQLEYRTVWGEEVEVTLEGLQKPIHLQSLNGILWEGTTELEALPSKAPLAYRYSIYRDGTCVRCEQATTAHLFIPTAGEHHHYFLNDFWKDLPVEAYLYSSAFSGNPVTPRHRRAVPSVRRAIVFRALCPCLHAKHQVLALSGDHPALGQWNPERALPMEEIAPNVWSATLDADTLSFPLHYKFVTCAAGSRQVLEWEEHDNRTLDNPGLQEGDTFLTEEVEVHFASFVRKVAGTAIPVFSLRSEHSFGVGDFGDLKRLVDWAECTHQRAIQILPINDTTITNTWTDSYPYNSISIYAFHPMYIDVSQLGEMKNRKLRKELEEKRKQLNALPQIDYEAMSEAKGAYLREMFRQEGNGVLSSDEFQKFFKQNAHWLMPYAAFSVLRDRYRTSDFSQWPTHSVYHAKEIKAFCEPGSEDYPEVAYYYYLQYALHVQLLAAGDYAREKGIILKGDIPIGISRCSVESWVEPYYFNMNGQAGAPPDAFSLNGQNWGFPTYNWEVMEQDHYHWWQRRFRKMAEYFTAYRIDHILGFFRIWEIPTHSVHGLLGQFSPSLPMSREEVESFGLPFREEFLHPFIDEALLQKYFGERTEEVKARFLQPLTNQRYEMRPEFDTQRKVEAFFANKQTPEEQLVRDGLYALISDVLFVPDRKDPSLVHPRIVAQLDAAFTQLSEPEQAAFNRLYEHYYYQRHNEFWYHEAMKKLPMLTQATPMLVCGEDLGMVPECVPWVMNQLQILSLEIQRMPKEFGVEFGRVEGYPLRSVCTISTHDMSTLRGWWEEEPEASARYYHEMLGHTDEAPKQAPGTLCEEIVRRHLHSPSLLCILSFQDWLSMDERLRYPDASFERINVPANPRNYWRYRMHLTLEELMQQKEFNQRIAQLIDESGR
jgi:4-alpha-glucanotransferase